MCQHKFVFKKTHWECFWCGRKAYEFNDFE